MCGSRKVPKLDPGPERTDPAVQEAIDLERELARKRRGRRSTILTSAQEAVAGTPYEEDLHKEIQKRTSGNKINVARDAYEGILKAIKSAPIAYDDNIAKAQAAMADVEGTSYHERPKKTLAGLERDRLEAIGKTLYAQAKAQVSSTPKEFEANVTALEELKAKAAGSPFERSIAKLL